MIEINEKQKREIDGYKKIFEEVKSYSISIKRKNEETEKKICTLVDYDISLKKDNILLNEVIKTSEKLNNINNNVNKLLQVEIDDTKKRLDMANKKIEDFYQSFNILKNNYLKYKQDNDKKMMLLIQCNDDLKKELEEKKNIQMYNDQCKIRMDDFNRSTILLEYYEIKNKVNNVNKTILWNKINMLYCHLYDERRKDKNDVHNILYDINNELKKENSFKKKILHNSISNETTPNENIVNKILIRSKYDEDIFLKNHRSIYGSYYDKEKNKWGFKCCTNIDKNSKCTNNTNCSYNLNNNLIKKDLTKSKNKKKKKKKLIVDNSITAVLNKI